MGQTDGHPTFRDRDGDALPIEAFTRAEDVVEAMVQSVQGGEFHARPSLGLPEGPHAASEFLEVGLALRQCLEDQSRHDYLIQRLKPHRSVIIGSLPAGIKQGGLLPHLPAERTRELGFRQLEAISDAEIRRWLIADGGLIYGELKRYELDNYIDFVAPLVRPGGKMYDLGSGLGKVVMSLGLALPFARCVGVELLPYRHRLALERLNALLALRDRSLAAMTTELQADQPLHLSSGYQGTADHLLDLSRRLEFLERDFFEVDLGDADLVFIYSTCFAPLMPRLADKLARELPTDALVSTTTFQLTHPALELVRHFPGKTLAWTDVFFYRRIEPSEPRPGTEPAALYEPDAQEWEARVRKELAALA